MALSPVFRSPLTDLTGCLHSFQGHPKCAKFEMTMIDCFEAYGMRMGTAKCKEIVEDFQECVGQQKQRKRIHAMRAERDRQYAAGELKEHYAPGPKEDAY